MTIWPGVGVLEMKAGFLRLEKGQVDDLETSREIRLTSEVTVIGRPSGQAVSGATASPVNIRDDYVSRAHATITYDFEKQCFLAEERAGGTQNGTFINGNRIEPGRRYPLRNGDLIGLAQVGDDFRVVFRFREGEMTLAAIPVAALIPAENITIDLHARTVTAGNRPISLRRKEFDLLAFLYQNLGKACSRNEIAQQVWAEEGGIVAEETIDTVVHRIRERIEADPSKPRFLVTLPRFGFRLDL